MFSDSLDPTIGVVEDRERPLAVADLELVLFLHHLDERGVPWGVDGGGGGGDSKRRGQGVTGRRQGDEGNMRGNEVQFSKLV